MHIKKAELNGKNKIMITTKQDSRSLKYPDLQKLFSNPHTPLPLSL